MVAILFEGVSDENFFNSILDEYELPKNEVNKIIYVCSGRDSMKITSINYETLETIIIYPLATISLPSFTHYVSAIRISSFDLTFPIFRTNTIAISNVSSRNRFHFCSV